METDTNGNEELPQPYCVLDAATIIGPPGDIAATLTYNAAGSQAYVTQTQNQWIADAYGLPWTPWGCFDVLPKPLHIAALRVGNGLSEVFTTTIDGRLFVRREFSFGWVSEQLNLPYLSSRAADVAAVGSRAERPHIFIADPKGIYFRYKTAEEAHSAYGPWQLAAATLASRIAIGVHPDRTLELFMLDADGALASAVQLASTLGTDFGAWTSVTIPVAEKVVDVDCGYSAANHLLLYAVTDSGTLWRRELDDTGWAAWVSLSDQTTPKLVSIAAVDVGTELFSISRDGSVYRNEAGNQWIAMP